MLIYKMRNYRFDTVSQPDVPESAGTIFKNLLSIGIPIALGSVALSLINLIDAGLCMTRLQSAVGYTYSHAKTLYGVYGKAQTLFNLPAAFITPLTVSIVPAISAKLVMDAREEAGKISEDSLRIAIAIALPMGVGLAVLCEPIMNVIYPNAHESGPLLLCLLGVASVFVCFSLMSTAVLQATGKERLTLYSIVAGGLVKITINWFIVAIPSINIYGAAIGTICCYVTMCVLNLIFINRSFEKGLSMKNIFVRPARAQRYHGCHSACGILRRNESAFGRQQTHDGACYVHCHRCCRNSLRGVGHKASRHNHRRYEAHSQGGEDSKASAYGLIIISP